MEMGGIRPAPNARTALAYCKFPAAPPLALRVGVARHAGPKTENGNPGAGCRRLDMVGVVGFEPTAPCSQSRYATELRHTPWPRAKYLAACTASRRRPIRFGPAHPAVSGLFLCTVQTLDR